MMKNEALTELFCTLGASGKAHLQEKGAELLGWLREGQYTEERELGAFEKALKDPSSVPRSATQKGGNSSRWGGYQGYNRSNGHGASSGGGGPSANGHHLANGSEQWWDDGSWYNNAVRQNGQPHEGHQNSGWYGPNSGHGQPLALGGSTAANPYGGGFSYEHHAAAMAGYAAGAAARRGGLCGGRGLGPPGFG